MSRTARRGGFPGADGAGPAPCDRPGEARADAEETHVTDPTTSGATAGAHASEGGGVVIVPAEIEAVVFDLDGVITDTASVHEASWHELLTAYLARRGGDAAAPFTSQDYLQHVDGKPRYDGVRDFLGSRGITLPEGEDDDPADRETVRGLGNRKNEAFRRLLAEGIEPYPSSVALVEQLVAHGVGVAIVSSSRNTTAVLTAAGLAERFPVIVDGNDLASRGLAGKPDPAMFLDAASQLGAEPARSVVVEDAVSGVAAGRRGGFRIVVGVDRADQAEALRAAGATVVVRDLGEIRIDGPARRPARGATAPPAAAPPAGATTRAPRVPERHIAQLPDAISARQELTGRLRDRRVAVFLDYDGTLSAIVDDPDAAAIDPGARAAVERLARVATVAVVSGRDADDVRERVGVGGIVMAGSHGLDLRGPDGAPTGEDRGAAFVPALDAAEEQLRSALADVPGVHLERKRATLAVHLRRVPPEHRGPVGPAVEEALALHPELRRAEGKQVLELRPDIDWDKGTAVLHLLDAIPGAGDAVPLYVGDDLTDEDAFRAIRGRGIGVVVRGEEDRPTAAEYRLDDVQAVADFLGDLAVSLGKDRTAERP